MRARVVTFAGRGPGQATRGPNAQWGWSRWHLEGHSLSRSAKSPRVRIDPPAPPNPLSGCPLWRVGI
jgi:hypothetical protein